MRAVEHPERAGSRGVNSYEQKDDGIKEKKENGIAKLAELFLKRDAKKLDKALEGIHMRLLAPSETFNKKSSRVVCFLYEPILLHFPGVRERRSCPPASGL
jgi:hypothetical protein